MNRTLIRIALLAAAGAMLQGCAKLYKEDMEDCYEGVSVALHVDPSTSGADEAAAAAEHAVLYVFDGEGRFLERRETEIGKVELLSHQEAGPLTVVGWINNHDSFDATEFHDTSLRESGLVTLTRTGATRTEAHSSTRSATRDAGDDHRLPTDLFYGETALVNERMSLTVEHKDLFAGRLTGQATVTVRGLRDYSGIRDDDFHIVVSPTAGAVDFFGNLHSYDTGHSVDCGFAPMSGDYVTGNFNLLPTDADTPLTVQIWHRGTDTLIYETDANHAGGDDIHIHSDRTTHILIDFSRDISISIEQARWNSSASWKTYN
jgi:hypothetical protein